MIKNKHYLIYDKNINKTTNIALFADIHYSNIFKEKKFKLIKENLYDNKQDYICIPGDIIDSTNVLDDSKKTRNISRFF